jgi:MscS family membrane protein
MKNKPLSVSQKHLYFCDRPCPCPNSSIFLARLALALLIFFSALPAQTLSGLLENKAGNSSSQPPVDPLTRTTPRDAIFHFLQACHSQRYVLAARYLDLAEIPADRRKTQGPELAKQLADILDKEQNFEVDALSDSPEGNTRDGLAADLETLVQVNTDASHTALLLKRVKQQGIDVWLVSSDSVPRIPDMDAMEGASEMVKKMPPVLVRHQVLGTPLWAWLVLIAFTLLLILLSRLLSHLFLAIFTPLIKRYAKSLEGYRLATLTGPLRLLISVGVFRAFMELAAPSALLRDYLVKLLALLSAFGFAALIVRIVDSVATQVHGRLGAKEHALSYSVLPLGVRFIRILVFLMAGLVILASWGYNTNTILAGLGVGGLAVALAAQKTIENLFGSIALISDRPVLVGDFCQFGGQTGTVEDIGLRSTRIRTNDRSLVTIPNANFSTMTIENFSRRDQMWFHPTLRLRRDTSPAKVREMIDAVTAVLHDHPLVRAGAVPIRFAKIADYALELEIFAYVATPNFDEYLKVQTALLLKFLEASQRTGVGFAIPVAEAININPPDAIPTANSDSHPGVMPPAELRQQG